MAKTEAPVRCVQCRCEYDLPRHGEQIACPECGNPSWVSTRIDAPQAPAHEAA